MSTASTGVFALYSKYYDLLYKDKAYQAETDYVAKLLETHGNEVRDILELGSGTGKHGKLLAQKGYNVHGIERSADMVEIALSDNYDNGNGNFTSEVGDITKYKSEKQFDAVISLFHVISYITDNDSLLSVFQQTYNHLHKEGVFIFDVWYTPAVLSQRPETRIKRVSDDELSVIRIAEPAIHPNENIVDVKYTVFAEDKVESAKHQFEEVHRMRHFTWPEVEVIARHTGFKLIHAEEFLSGNDPGENTWGVCFILKK